MGVSALIQLMSEPLSRPFGIFTKLCVKKDAKIPSFVGHVLIKNISRGVVFLLMSTKEDVFLPYIELFATLLYLFN